MLVTEIGLFIVYNNLPCTICRDAREPTWHRQMNAGKGGFGLGVYESRKARL